MSTFAARPVTLERWADLQQLFDRPIVRTCFCQFYRKAGDTGAGRSNREAMKALVEEGTVPGLIGYEDGVPVAWISLAPRHEFGRLQRSRLLRPVDDRPVWSIVCFFVPREARGRGLARKMLRAAVDFARSRGARLVEGYPVDIHGPTDPEGLFVGTSSMFADAGFREVARRKPTRPVMRRTLQSTGD